MQLDPKRFDHLSWEYQVLSLEATGDTDLEAQMNDEGTMGWELVSSKRKDEDWITYIWKRPANYMALTAG